MKRTPYFMRGVLQGVGGFEIKNYRSFFILSPSILSAQFENLGELVKNLIFPVGVDTFPTELSGRLRHVLSPAEAVPETLAGYSCFRNIY